MKMSFVTEKLFPQMKTDSIGNEARISVSGRNYFLRISAIGYNQVDPRPVIEFKANVHGFSANYSYSNKRNELNLTSSIVNPTTHISISPFSEQILGISNESEIFPTFSDSKHNNPIHSLKITSIASFSPKSSTISLFGNLFLSSPRFSASFDHFNGKVNSFGFKSTHNNKSISYAYKVNEKSHRFCLAYDNNSHSSCMVLDGNAKHMNVSLYTEQKKGINRLSMFVSASKELKFVLERDIDSDSTLKFGFSHSFAHSFPPLLSLEVAFASEDHP